MATFAQSIEVKLNVNTTDAFAVLKTVEDKLSKIFSGGGSSSASNQVAGVNAVTQAVGKQAGMLQKFAEKVGNVFSGVNFEAVKKRAESVASTIKQVAEVKPRSTTPEAQGWIRAGDAAKRYSVDVRNITKWAERGADASLKSLEKLSGAQFGGKRTEAKAFPLASKEDYFNIPTAAADRYYNKVQLLNRVINQGLTQSGSNARVLVAYFDKMYSVLQPIVNRVSEFARKLGDAGRVAVGKSIEVAETKAKAHETTLKRVFNAYMAIYKAPVKMAGRMLGFGKTQAPTEQTTPTWQNYGIPQAGGITGTTVAIAQMKSLQVETQKTVGILGYLKKALVFTVTLPLQPFKLLTSTAGWAFGKVKEYGLLAFAAISAAVVMSFKNSLDSALSFSKEMGLIWTLMDVSKKTLDTKIEKDVKENALKAGADLKSSAQQLYWSISAGINETMGFTEKETKNVSSILHEAAAVTGANAADTTKTIIAMANAYENLMEKDVVQRVAKIRDLMFQTTYLGIVSFQDLAAEMGPVAAIGAQMKIPLQELLSLVSFLTQKGVNPAIAMTSLRSTMAEILKPSEEAQQLARRIGLDFSVAAVESKGLIGFLQEVFQKTNGDIEKIVVLFNNVRSLSTVMSHLGDQPRLAKFLSEMYKAGETGAGEKAFEKVAQTTEFKERVIKTRFEIRSEELGKLLVPEWQKIKVAYLDIMESISFLVKSFWMQFAGDKTASDAFRKQYEDAVGKMPKGLRTVMQVISWVVTWFAHASNAAYNFFTKIGNAISDEMTRLKAEIGFDFIQVTLNEIGNAWQVVVDKIGTGVVYAIKFVSGLISSFLKIGQAAKEPVKEIEEWSLIREFGNTFLDIAENIVEILLEVGKTIKAAFNEAMKLEKQWGAVSTALKIVAVLIIAPLLIVAKIVNWVLELFQAWLWVQGAIRKVVSLLVEGVAMAVWAVINPMDALRAAWETIVGLIGWAWDGIKWMAKSMADLFIALGNFSMADFLKGTYTNAPKDMQKKVEDAQDAIQKKQKDTADKYAQNQKKQVEIAQDAQKKMQDTAMPVTVEQQREMDALQEETNKILGRPIGTRLTPNAAGVYTGKKETGMPITPEDRVKETLANEQKAAEQIIEETQKTAQKTLEIKNKEKIALREIQFQKEQDELRHLSRMSDYIESDLKRNTNKIKKGIEEQTKIIEKAKEKQADFLKRKGEAEEDFEEKKARIIMSPLSQEGKDIQQRGLANLYQNKLAQALGQNNFQEAHVLAKKVQDIYASLAERSDNAMKEADFKKFLSTQEQVMRVFDAEKKNSDEAIQSASKKIVDLKQELVDIFATVQKDLSISISTDLAESQLTELRKKFIEMRKDFGEYLPGGENFQYERNPEVKLFGEKKEAKNKQDQGKDNGAKMLRTQEKSSDTLEDILQEIKTGNQKTQNERSKGFSQDSRGNFVVNTVGAE